MILFSTPWRILAALAILSAPFVVTAQGDGPEVRSLELDSPSYCFPASGPFGHLCYNLQSLCEARRASRFDEGGTNAARCSPRNEVWCVQWVAPDPEDPFRVSDNSLCHPTRRQMLLTLELLRQHNREEPDRSQHFKNLELIRAWYCDERCQRRRVREFERTGQVM